MNTRGSEKMKTRGSEKLKSAAETKPQKYEEEKTNTKTAKAPNKRLQKAQQKAETSKFDGNYREGRLQRGMVQRMFLMHAERLSDILWRFTVQGSSGSAYKLTIQKNRGMQCGCRDFSIHRKTCKHLYFIVCQVAQQEELLQNVKSKPILDAATFEKLDAQLVKRLKNRLENTLKPTIQLQADYDFGADDICCICFEELAVTDATQCKKGCKKIIHNTCMIEWLKQNTNCPLCRQPWELQKLQDQKDDPLSKLQVTEISIPQLPE